MRKSILVLLALMLLAACGGTPAATPTDELPASSLAVVCHKTLFDAIGSGKRGVTHLFAPPRRQDAKTRKKPKPLRLCAFAVISWFPIAMQTISSHPSHHTVLTE